ncbi:3-hydroxyacyl-CoA dehydrogenase NAD-binding domain-containing protein [Endozoicomonas elysicola]|uniref:3-hydroxyacyl-CoA dehydrogenase NAD binding domain-containing protein n=1 Tax=Endozoicomonas elysicola TaxID=305900 RepID=A0A081KDX1_9GAMM|nr:3-hydroxyacyl-CoA dehydrogenase NAD-binding domain-containing protein [Endozoicomonas elysicola]KEI72347.1 hypothetical protein GV64_17870 [Endozoicomonas elysicola]
MFYFRLPKTSVLICIFVLFYSLAGNSETVVVLGYGRTGKVFTHKLHQKLGDDVKVVIVDTEPKRINEAVARWGAESDQHTFTYRTHYDQVLESEWADTIFIQELINENVWKKQALIEGVLDKLESAGKTDVVVASNSSSIPVSVLTEYLPEHQKTRVSVNHMYSPHGAASEVGVLYGPITESDSQVSADQSEKLLQAETTARTVERFNARLGIESFRLNNHGLEIKDQIGHSFNRIWFRIKEHFIDMLGKNLINRQLADLAFIIVYNRPLGIFGTMDMISLNTAIDIRHVWKTYGACSSEMPLFVRDMAGKGETFYPPCTRPDCTQKNIFRLLETSAANQEGLLEYGWQNGLMSPHWESELNRMVNKELNLEERYPEVAGHTAPDGGDIIHYLNVSSQLRMAVYLLAGITIQEYRHTVLRNSVISPESMDHLLNILTGQDRLFSRLNQLFPVSFGLPEVTH